MSGKEINITALKDRVDKLYDWKENCQALAVKQAKSDGRIEEAIKNLKGAVHDIREAVDNQRLAKEAHINGVGWSKVRIVGGGGIVLALIKIAEWVVEFFFG